MPLQPDEISSLVSEALPKVKERVLAEIENSLVQSALTELRTQIVTCVKKEFEEILAAEIHQAIEGQKPLIITEIQASLRTIGESIGAALVNQTNEKLKSSWNVKELVDKLLR